LSTPNPSTTPRRFSRRSLLGWGGAGAALAVGGAAAWRLLRPTPINPTGEAVVAAESGRPRTGQVVTRQLRAAAATVDLGGRQVKTWAYDEALPAAPIRVRAGDELRVTLINELPEPTSIHWHGLELRNDMDGVPGLTMPWVASGSKFDYAFLVPHPGTYWFHPHHGVQLDSGLYAPLIVEDPEEPGDYDEEAVLILDDWTDGWGDSPTAILAAARRDGMGGMAGMDHMGGMGMPTAEQPLGTDTGDVRYPAHLINGRLPRAPYTVSSAPGRRIRLRLINAGSDTAYRFAVGDHRLTVTHTDGRVAQHVEVDTLIIGMGERYDVTITAGNGVFPIIAVPEGKDDPVAFGLLRTGSGTRPNPTVRPAELNGRLLNYDDLSAGAGDELGAEEPDRQLEMKLTMADGGRRWLINGRVFGDHQPLEVKSDERVRIVLDNQSMMFHPIHLHGHTFALSRPDGRGARKDTINVLPMQQLPIDIVTDNPGQWLVHCHQTYHAELGMTTVLSYLT
jgi:multicopper oxidase